MTSAERYTELIKHKAQELGFFACRIAKARRLDDEANQLEKWLSKGYHASMTWMENHFEKRVDPTQLVPGAKSVISLAFNYFPEEKQNSGFPKIAKYAYGRDYHKVLKKKLITLLDFIQEEIGEVHGRAFVDSGPVLERQWAEKSGIGWLGKNALLLSKSKGSFFFLAELILDLELISDHPTTDHCGTCTRCIDSCPTDAIVAPQVIDSNRCISHATIELKDKIPNHFQNLMEDWVFGCDICQDVCPWNRFSQPNQESDFTPLFGRLDLSVNDWIEMTEEVFGDLFNGTAVRRAGLEKIRSTVKFNQKE